MKPYGETHMDSRLAGLRRHRKWRICLAEWAAMRRRQKKAARRQAREQITQES